MKSLKVVLIVCLLIYGSHGTKKSREEIVKEILGRANPNNIPIVDEQPVKVSFKYSLQDIYTADVGTDQVELGLWLVISWKDRSLSWSNECTTFNELTLPSKYIWLPHIEVYNSIGKPGIHSDQLVRVYKDGTVTFVPQYTIRFSCALENVTTEQGAACTLKFGPWTYDVRDLVLDESQQVDLTTYAGGERFQLIEAKQKVNKKTYPCCPQSFEDIELRITFKKI
ncbi:acetylcholine-binding protein [Biomphalaria glabrata]|nr:acetylcholine-binding protein [Biomphalaria glabrata]